LRRRRDKKKDKKKDDEEEEELIFGWAKVPLIFEQVLYAALDARLGFDIVGGTGSYKATIAMLLVSTFRWMIVDVWCVSLQDFSCLLLLFYWMSIMFGKMYSLYFG
jgi:hypothetical protein